MKLTETSTPDINNTNLDESKLKLANTVISNIYPKFDQEYIKKDDQIKNLKEELKSKKDKILNEKGELQKLLIDFNREKKILKLVNRIQRIISVGGINDSTIKNEMIVLLKVCEDINDKKIDKNLKNTKEILQKRYSKV